MVYENDWGNNAANCTSLHQSGFDLPDGARYRNSAVAVKKPQRIGIVLKFVPTPDAPMECELIHIFAKVCSNASIAFDGVRASAQRCPTLPILSRSRDLKAFQWRSNFLRPVFEEGPPTGKIK